MSDWRDKLAGLNRELQAKEQAVQEAKAATLKGFRQRLEELKPVLENAQAFGDAFGVDITFQISRFDQRYPSLALTIKKPALQLRLECRDGVIYERLQEGSGPAKEVPVPLESLAVKEFERRLTAWVQGAAEANRKLPGRRS
ncbi:MAG: hypothetical protein ACOY93_04080 [Bacillota bacterium]